MAHSIFAKALSDLRWQVVWYGLGIGLLAAMIVYIFPSYREQFANFQIPEALQGFVGDGDFTSATGFLSAEFFSWAPAMLAVFAIMAGTSALAGEEVAGTLDLLLAQPISRRALALQKMAAILVSTCLILLMIYAGWLLSVPFVAIEISCLKLAAATLALLPITLLFAAISLWASVALADRRVATGAVSALAVFSYFANYLPTIVDVLAPLRWLSFFYYLDATNILSHIDLWKPAVLVLATLVFAGLTLLAFDQRDIGSRTAFVFPGLARLRHRQPAAERP